MAATRGVEDGPLLNSSHHTQCAHDAAAHGHVHVLKYLFEAYPWGRHLLVIVDDHDMSAAQLAAAEEQWDAVYYIGRIGGLKWSTPCTLKIDGLDLEPSSLVS